VAFVTVVTAWYISTDFDVFSTFQYGANVVSQVKVSVCSKVIVLYVISISLHIVATFVFMFH